MSKIPAQDPSRTAVVLREAKGERVLPVFVGLTDALSIWRSAAGWDPPRPFAHDLMGRLLEGSGLRVESCDPGSSARARGR